MTARALAVALVLLPLVLLVSIVSVRATIRSIYPDAVVAPYLVVVVTDSRNFARLSENVLRILPLRMTHDDLERVHGSDERISIHRYEDAIRAYRQLILNVAG